MSLENDDILPEDILFLDEIRHYIFMSDDNDEHEVILWFDDGTDDDE